MATTAFSWVWGWTKGQAEAEPEKLLHLHSSRRTSGEGGREARGRPSLDQGHDRALGHLCP
jgi:hypothetical protein